MGGIDGFIGDGKINYKPEQVVNIFYKWHVLRSSWLSFDYTLNGQVFGFFGKQLESHGH